MTEEPTFKDAVTEDILRRLSEGESMRSICSDDRMPNRETLRRWCDADPAFEAAIMRARENGFHDRAERAVEEAKKAEDAAKGRLAFDAERWYLGKLSRAFADKVVIQGDTERPIEHKHDLSGLTPEQLEALASIRLDNEG